MAQLVERLVRNEEASGSNPLISTKPKPMHTKVYIGFFFVPKKRHKGWPTASGDAIDRKR